ncbi:MAG: DUF502 domain-containing protein [Cyanobacteria bacterium]|nr:DUF502 domain-containing protein [Cyanobacteriota bacterium]
MLRIETRTKEIIRTFFLKGLVWSVPAILTLWLLSVVSNLADSFMGPVTKALLNALVPDWLLVGPLANGESPFVSLLLLVVLLAMIGGFISWRWGERIARAIDTFFAKLPGLGFVYRSTRVIANFFDGSKASPFERVVLVPYPHKDVYTLAFVAGQTTIKQLDGKEEVFLKVVVPNPPTGIQGLIFVPKHLVLDVPLTVADGLQFYISAGMVSPPVIAIEAPGEFPAPGAAKRG